MVTGLLKSRDRPAGWALPELLRRILLELDERAVALEVDEDPRAPVLDQVAGKLRDAYGVARGAARPMRLVRERALEAAR
jgi:hypothetical protein